MGRGVGELNWKQWRNTQGSAERCQGHLSVQCRDLSGFGWVVTEEADLTLFLSSTAFTDKSVDKSVENIWELSSKGKGQDSSWLVTIVSYDWEIYGRGWGLVPIPCSGPIGKRTYYFKILAPPGVTQKNWPFSDQSTQGDLRLSDGKSEAQNRRWNESGVTPGGVIFIPDEFNLKWETESQKKKQWGIRKPNSY